MVSEIHTETSSLENSHDYAQKPQRDCTLRKLIRLLMSTGGEDARLK